LNPKKCQSTSFGMEAQMHNNWGRAKFQLNGQVIPRDACPKYLGVILDRRLSWIPHARYVAKKLQNKYNLLRKLASTSYGLPIVKLRIVYQAIFRSILEYASCVWLNQIDPDSPALKRLEVLDRKAKRLVLGALPGSPNNAIDVEISVPPLFLRVEQSSLRFILKTYKDHLSLLTTAADEALEESSVTKMLRLGEEVKIINPIMFPDVCVTNRYTKVPKLKKGNEMIQN